MSNTVKKQKKKKRKKTINGYYIANGKTKIIYDKKR